MPKRTGDEPMASIYADSIQEQTSPKPFNRKKRDEAVPFQGFGIPTRHHKTRYADVSGMRHLDRSVSPSAAARHSHRGDLQPNGTSDSPKMSFCDDFCQLNQGPALSIHPSSSMESPTMRKVSGFSQDRSVSPHRSCKLNPDSSPLRVNRGVEEPGMLVQRDDDSSNLSNVTAHGDVTKEKSCKSSSSNQSETVYETCVTDQSTFSGESSREQQHQLNATDPIGQQDAFHQNPGLTVGQDGQWMSGKQRKRVRSRSNSPQRNTTSIFGAGHHKIDQMFDHVMRNLQTSGAREEARGPSDPDFFPRGVNTSKLYHLANKQNQGQSRDLGNLPSSNELQRNQRNWWSSNFADCNRLVTCLMSDDRATLGDENENQDKDQGFCPLVVGLTQECENCITLEPEEEDIDMAEMSTRMRKEISPRDYHRKDDAPLHLSMHSSNPHEDEKATRELGGTHSDLDNVCTTGDGHEWLNSNDSERVSTEAPQETPFVGRAFLENEASHRSVSLGRESPQWNPDNLSWAQLFNKSANSTPEQVFKELNEDNAVESILPTGDAHPPIYCLSINQHASAKASTSRQSRRQWLLVSRASDKKASCSSSLNDVQGDKTTTPDLSAGNAGKISHDRRELKENPDDVFDGRDNLANNVSGFTIKDALIAWRSLFNNGDSSQNPTQQSNRSGYNSWVFESCSFPSVNKPCRSASLVEQSQFREPVPCASGIENGSTSATDIVDGDAPGAQIRRCPSFPDLTYLRDDGPTKSMVSLGKNARPSSECNSFRTQCPMPLRSSKSEKNGLTFPVSKRRSKTISLGDVPRVSFQFQGNVNSNIEVCAHLDKASMDTAVGTSCASFPQEPETAVKECCKSSDSNSTGCSTQTNADSCLDKSNSCQPLRVFKAAVIQLRTYSVHPSTTALEHTNQWKTKHSSLKRQTKRRLGIAQQLYGSLIRRKATKQHCFLNKNVDSRQAAPKIKSPLSRQEQRKQCRNGMRKERAESRGIEKNKLSALNQEGSDENTSNHGLAVSPQLFAQALDNSDSEHPRVAPNPYSADRFVARSQYLIERCQHILQRSQRTVDRSRLVVRQAQKQLLESAQCMSLEQPKLTPGTLAT